MFNILAMETSCDETAAAIIQDGRIIRSNIVASQIDEHKLYGGVVPEIASRRHAENISGVVEAALAEAGATVGELDAIAVTAAPGLIGALLVGVNFAKGLAFGNQLPLVPVHHIRGHIASNYLAHPGLEPPFLSMVVSGGHSHIVLVKSYTEFEILGRTMDDAAGEAFDKVARTLGYPYPGGVYIDNAAKDGNPQAYKLPRPHTENPLYFSFSGLKTAVINLVHNLNQKGESYRPQDVAASFQQTVVEILTHKFLLAAQQTGQKTLTLAGGVAANSQLRDHLTSRCQEEGLTLYLPPKFLCGDNAAMIGAQGFYEFQAGSRAQSTLNAFATMEITDKF